MRTVAVLLALSKGARYSKGRSEALDWANTCREAAQCCTTCGDIVLALSNDLIMLWKVSRKWLMRQTWVAIVQPCSAIACSLCD